MYDHHNIKILIQQADHMCHSTVKTLCRSQSLD